MTSFWNFAIATWELLPSRLITSTFRQLEVYPDNSLRKGTAVTWTNYLTAEEYFSGVHFFPQILRVSIQLTFNPKFLPIPSALIVGGVDFSINFDDRYSAQFLNLHECWAPHIMRSLVWQFFPFHVMKSMIWSRRSRFWANSICWDCRLEVIAKCWLYRPSRECNRLEYKVLVICVFFDLAMTLGPNFCP